jgi:hypothetical protein
MAAENVTEGYRYVLDLDLEKFFDKVNRKRAGYAAPRN